MRAPFVVRIESASEAAAARLADALRPLVQSRASSARVESGRRSLPGTTATVGVRDPEGYDKWLMPLRIEDEPESAARDVMAFLERWGFVPRAAPRRAA